MAYEVFDLSVSATRCLSRLALHPVVVLPNHEWIGNAKRAWLIVSKIRPRACLCQNLRRHSRISALRTKVEILGLQAYQNLMVSVTSTADIRCHNSRISAGGVSTGVILLGGYRYGRTQAD
jgi:hypothetical protein